MRVVFTLISAVCALLIMSVGCWLLYAAYPAYYIFGYIALCLIFYPLAVYLHEAGHYIFGKMCRTKVKINVPNALRAASCSQIMPLNSGRIKKKIVVTASGGIFVNAIFVVLGCAAFLLSERLVMLSFVAPPSMYLLMLNAIPFETSQGKTDAKVICMAVSCSDEYQVLERVLEIQGMLAEGKPIESIAEDFFYSVPQLPEDCLEFIMLVSLRADYYAATGNAEKAQECANRLQELKEYLPDAYLQAE